MKILKEFQQNRADMHAEIKRMRDDYTMSLLIGEGFQGDDQQAGKNDKGKDGNQATKKPQAAKKDDDKESNDEDDDDEEKDEKEDDKMEL